MPNTKEVEPISNPILTGYRETLQFARDNAIEHQEQENREDYHIGREDAFNYALEMLSKHEALSNPLEQSEKKEEWVSVAERLPLVPCFVLVVKTSSPNVIGLRYNSAKKFKYGHQDFTKEVTHWQPLPNAPKPPKNLV